MRADAGLNILVSIIDFFEPRRAVFLHRSYSPVGIATGVNWASDFGCLVRD